MWKTHIIKCQKCLSENNIVDQEKYPKILDDIREKKLDFDNIVFSGGGMRCVGYLGTVQVLEELNLLTGITRFAGSSGGSIFALMCSMRYSADEIYSFASSNQSKYLDRSCVWLNWWYNLFYGNFGLYRGKTLEADIKKVINDKIKQNFPSKYIDGHDTTFQELYDCYGTEVVIVATNLSKLCGEYFSHKLTPNMPLYLAIRMSISIPGYFESVVHKNQRYIDGSMSENYPLDIFFCSNKFIDCREDAVEKTIGLCLLSSTVKIVKGIDRYEIENKSSTPINTAHDYAFSIIDFVCNQNFEDEMTLINEISKGKGGGDDAFFKCTIPAYTPCITTSDFNANLETKLDTIAIFKYLTIDFLLKK